MTKKLADLATLYADPVGYIDFKDVNAIIEEESTIAAAELVGPNSIEYAAVCVRKHAEFSDKYLRLLGLKLCRGYKDLEELLKGVN